MVARVVSRSPADKAGVRAGDIIISINGKFIEGLAAFSEELNTIAGGSVANLILMRDRMVLQLAVQLTSTAGSEAVVSTLPAPLLRLETGGHTARITSLEFSESGERLVSAGDDKTIRVWSLSSAQLERTFRGYQQNGPNGRIYATGLFPDETRIAIAGYLFEEANQENRNNHIRIMNLSTGEVDGVLKGHRDTINKIVVTRDGRAVISGGNDGVIISWDVKSSTERWRTPAGPWSVQDFVVSSDDKVIIAQHSDGSVESWDISSGRKINHRFMRDQHVVSISYCQSKGVLIAGTRSGVIQFWDVPSGRFKSELQSPRSSIGKIVCAPDGKHILVTCGQDCQNDYTAFVMNSEDGGIVSKFTGHNTRVIAAAISSNSEVVATAGGHERGISLWNLRTGRPLLGPNKSPLVFRGFGEPVFAVAANPESHEIAWGRIDKGSHNSNLEPLEFRLQLPNGSVNLGTPQIIRGDATRFKKAGTVLDTLSLAAVRGGNPERKYGTLQVVRSGAVTSEISRRSTDGYEHIAYAFGMNGRAIVSGGREGVLRSYKPDGSRLREFVGHDDAVWSVASIGDGKLLVSGSSDQTVRIWNIETGELIASLFNSSNGDWVMWTPQGFFTGSPGGSAVVGWYVNKGIENAGVYVTGEQYRRVLNRRDIVERALLLASAKAAVEIAYPGGFDLADLVASLPPQIRIVSPRQNSVVRNGVLTLTAEVAEGNIPLNRVEAFVNGNKVLAEEVPVLIGHPRPPPGWLLYSYEVPLYEGRNLVELVAYNNAGHSKRGGAVLAVNHLGLGHLDKRNVLHIVAVGVDSYPGMGNTCGQSRSQSCGLTVAGKMLLHLRRSRRRPLVPCIPAFGLEFWSTVRGLSMSQREPMY